MVIRGFDKETMKEIITHFVSDKRASSYSGERMLFQTRVVSNNSKGNNQDITDENIFKNQERKFKCSMAMLYIKTFYGRKPSDFKTEEYKKESERFNKILSSNKELKRRVEKCIEEDNVDFILYELPQDLFYSAFSNVGLSADNIDAQMFISPSFAPEARIYINPSSSDYLNLMTYIYEEASKQELAILTKTRMSDIGGPTLDNLILYTSAQDFEKFVKILNAYGEKYPEKVSSYGGIMAALGRSEQDWFGFGFEPQSNPYKPDGNTTFNNEINWLFNNYILPAIMMNDFEGITESLSSEDLSEIFASVCKDKELAEELVNTLKDPAVRRKFLADFCDLSLASRTSQGYNEENAKLTEEERKGFSPEVMRCDGQQSDVQLVYRGKVTIKLLNGEEITFSRQNFAQILKNPKLRDAMAKYYSEPGKIENEADEALSLWKYLGEKLPFLDDKYPFMSKTMTKALESRDKNAKTKEKGAGYKAFLERHKIKKALEDKQKKQEEVIKILKGGRYNLASACVKLLEESNQVPEGLSSMPREKLEELYITIVGLDDVIDANLNTEKEDKNKIYSYETVVSKLRVNRGEIIYNRIKWMEPDFLRTYCERLSDHAKEDLNKYCLENNINLNLEETSEIN